MSVTTDRAALRRAVASGDSERILRVALSHWTRAQDDDGRDWSIWQDAIDRAGGDVQVWWPKLRCARDEREVTRIVARRLRAHYDRSSAAERLAGRCWYADARAVAELLADAYGTTVAQAAYVLAALSPNTSWSANIRAAEHACEGYRDGTDPDSWRGAGYSENRRKAWRILSGELGALQGPKVTMFARGILGDPDACTVDVWMQRAAGIGGAVGSPAPTVREHRVIRAAIERVAAATGETVRDLQAIVWVHVRNESTGREET